MFTAALAGGPSSASALTGLSLVSTFEEKPDEAIKWGIAAVGANSRFAAGYVALYSAYTLAGDRLAAIANQNRELNRKIESNAERQDNEMKTKTIESQSAADYRLAAEALGKAQKLDPKILGNELTKVRYAWRYFNVGGRVPVLPMPN
jgi:tetratricopeptide (TPR) repeat protein